MLIMCLVNEDKFLICDSGSQNLKKHGYICGDSQQNVVCVKMIDFSLMPKIILILSKDHVASYFVHFPFLWSKFTFGYSWILAGLLCTLSLDVCRLLSHPLSVTKIMCENLIKWHYVISGWKLGYSSPHENSYMVGSFDYNTQFFCFP